MVLSRNGLLIACGVLVFTAMIANAVMKFHNMQVLHENDRRVSHTHQVKERLSALLTNFVDTQASVRGFVIVGQPDYLKPYENADMSISNDFRVLTDLVHDNPGQLSVLSQIRDLRDRHQDYLKKILAAYHEKGFDAASEVIKSGQGKSLVDGIRRNVNDMIATENSLLEDRSRIAKERYRQALTTGVIGTALSLVMTGLALLVFWQELRRRREAQSTLKTQIEETRLSAERFRLLTETVPVHIWISKPDGAASFLNRSWQDYTGLAADDAGVANWMSVVHPEDAKRLRMIWGRTDGGSQDIYLDEIRIRRGIDQAFRWHRCAIVPVRTRRGALQSWVGTLADIQDQKDQSESLEQAVRQRTQELRHANGALQEEVNERIRVEKRVRAVAAELRRSNEELEKFAYVASHDLQEPLRKIQAFGDRLHRKSHENLDEQSRGYIERMLVSAGRMRTLIDDLLTFSRVASTSQNFVLVDLNVTLAGVLTDLEMALTQSQGRVESRPLPTIEADPLLMRQLFQNLIGNALKFAKPGESPVVSIDAIPLSSLSASVDPPPKFSGWRLSFADRGIGFDQVHERRIFELFQRLHGRDQYQGTGIGLAICRKIAERHGGAIHARGIPGGGATFFVDLPEAPPQTLLVPS